MVYVQFKMKGSKVTVMKIQREHQMRDANSSTRNCAGVVVPLLFGGLLLLVWDCARTLDSEEGLLTGMHTELRQGMHDRIFFFM